MQRICAGKLRGRKLMGLPEGVPGLRPTGSRVREAIFDRLGPTVVDARVLDLFGGSGALSLEALSRGARSATVFEIDARVVRHLQAQIAALGLAALAEVRRGDALGLLARGPGGAGDGTRYDLVFVDPPFASPHVFTPVLAALCEHGWLADDAVVVCERERVRGSVPNIVLPRALTPQAARVYGQAQVEFFGHDGGAPDEDSTAPP